jgi:hypothetical protein
MDLVYHDDKPAPSQSIHRSALTELKQSAIADPARKPQHKGRRRNKSSAQITGAPKETVMDIEMIYGGMGTATRKRSGRMPNVLRLSAAATETGKDIDYAVLKLQEFAMERPKDKGKQVGVDLFRQLFSVESVSQLANSLVAYRDNRKEVKSHKLWQLRRTKGVIKRVLDLTSLMTEIIKAAQANVLATSKTMIISRTPSARSP